MRHRSRFVVAGLLAGLCPAGVWAAPVPSPTTPISPAPVPTTPIAPASPAAPEESVPVAAPPASETLPEPTPPATATPAPQPYTGGPPLTAPPGATTPQPYATPGAPPAPKQGVDLGGQSVSPLPPPPPSLDPSTIRRQPWRGRWWMGFKLGITGPVGGERPGAPTVLSLGGGIDLGWRINNVLGLGMGLSGQIHNKLRVSVQDPLSGEFVKRVANGRMLYWDALFARVHLPLKKRFQPYVEIGGGLARLGRAEGGRSFGAQMRAALGVEGWVSQTVTLGFAGTYRLNAINDKEGGNGWVVGHAMQGTFELGFHW